jgi:DNA primase catalytic core
MIKTNTAPSRSRKERHEDFPIYLEELKSRVDISTVAHRHGLAIDKHGHAVCFNKHDQKTPSLTFYEDSQTYHCFGCNAHGDAIGLVQAVQGCSFWDAVNSLALEAGMDLYQSENGFDPEVFGRVADCLEAAASIYHAWLEPYDSYLDGRGISYETAKRFMIGRTRERDDLCRSLQDKGIAADTLLMSGLVKDDGTDFFQDHIVVPIRSQGRVVDFYGRSLTENGGAHHWRLSKDRFRVGDGMFNWQPRAPETILVEGVFDTLALIQNGFPNAVGTFGTQGLKDCHVKKLSQQRAKKVWVCYDADESGRTAALRDGWSLAEAGIDVSIVDLPEDADPSDFLMDHSADEFQKCLNQAVSPLDLEISHLEKPDEALDKLLRRCQTMPPVTREQALKKISKKVGLSKKLLREQLTHLAQQDAPTQKNEVGEEITDACQIRPALDVVERKVLMGVKRVMRDVHSDVPRWIPWIVTSEREWFPFEQDELGRRRYFSTLSPAALEGLEQRYSAEAVAGFVEGTRSGDLPLTYERVRTLLGQYLDFADPNTYEFLTAWIIGTYVHVLFNYYPYVHFNGTKSVGKSKALRLLAALSFNGIWCVSISEASQFRLIESFQLTMCLDETEDLNQKQLGEKRALLLGGYEKGSGVYRTERRGDAFVPVRYNNFSPRALASIEGLEDVIGSRTVQIPMERSYDEEIKSSEVAVSDLLFQETRDELFLVAMAYGSEIQRIYETMDKPAGLLFGDREYNIFKPILAVGTGMESPEVETRLVQFANSSHQHKIEDNNETAEENILLRYLVERVTTDGDYRSDELHSGFIEFIRTQGLELQSPMSKSRMAKLMIKLRVCTKSSRTPDRKATYYRFELQTVRQVAENYHAY